MSNDSQQINFALPITCPTTVRVETLVFASCATHRLVSAVVRQPAKASDEKERRREGGKKRRRRRRRKGGDEAVGPGPETIRVPQAGKATTNLTDGFLPSRVHRR